MNLHSTRQLLAAFSLAGALAFVAACSGPSSSVSPTGPTGVAAAAATGGANFSPNPSVPPPPPPPEVCDRPAPWEDSGDGSGTCVCRAPNIFDPAEDTCTPPTPPPPPPPPGDEGCTPGYWKANAKLGGSQWAATGYSPAQTVGSIFAAGSFNSATLLQALQFGGGPGVAGATQILLRAAVAAVLNAASPNVEYPQTVASIVAEVNAAIASGDRQTILNLAGRLDTQNNLGCPIDNNER